jgi:hypothetical protein
MIAKEVFMSEQRSVQQHSGDWTMTGKVPVARGLKATAFARTKPEGREPFSTSRPWQDRRALILYRDQRPAILRMVFVCRSFAPFANP